VLKRIEEEERHVLACGFSATSGTPGETRRVVTASSSGASALFAPTIDAFFAPQFTATSVLAAVAARVVKSLIEHVRSDRIGARDASLLDDVARLRSSLEPKLGSDGAPVMQLLDQLSTHLKP
jgi:hypothetical protein